MILTEPWSKKHKKVNKAASGGQPYSLSNSFSQPLTHQELIELTLARGDQELVDAFNNHNLEYTPNGGSLDLRQAIADLYGPKIQADNVIVFTGAQAALQTAALALTNPLTHTIVFTPGYQSVQEAPLHAGSQLTRIKLSAENGWKINLNEVRGAIRENTRYMVINQPHNPTGMLMNHELQTQLKDLANEFGIYLLSDEVYRLLEHNPADRLPAMADLYRRGISCVTLSKPWGGAGITIGWLAFQDLGIKQSIKDAQYFGTVGPSRASELQAIMVLRASDAIIEKNMKIIRHNLQLLQKFIQTYDDLFEWVHPKAGAVGFVKFKGPLTTDELGAQLAAEGISMKPAYCFTDAVSEENDYFRVGYGEEKMPKSLDALIAFVEKNKSAWRRRARL